MHLVTTLRIHTVSLPARFTEILRSIPARNGFTHEFVEGLPDTAPQRLLRARTLVLVDSGQLNALGDAALACAPVLLERAPGSIAPAVLERCEDVWSVPDEARLTHCFSRYLDRLALFRDLRRKEIYLDTMLATTPALVWFKNCQGDHFSVSDTFCRTTKKTREDIEGKGHPYIWGMDEKEYENSPLACKESDARVLASGSIDVSEELVQSQRGIRTFSTWKGALRDADGAIIGTAGVAHDVTDMNTLSAELELLLGSLPFAVLITDEKDRIVNVNDRFRQMFRHAERIVTGKTPYHAARDRCGNMQSIFQNELRELLPRDGELPGPSRDDMFMDIQHKEILDRLQNRVGSIVIFRDVTEEHNKKMLLERHAYQDALTGLFNRRYFYEKIAARMDGGGLIYLDLDNFKLLNDRCGHQAGDECLQVIGEALRAVSANAVRMGGDEFAVYLPGATPDELEDAALRMEREARQRLTGRLALVTASIGIALCEQAGESMDSLVYKADAAMYENKGRRAALAGLEESLAWARRDGRQERVAVLERAVAERRGRATTFTRYAKGMEGNPETTASRRGR